MERLDRPETVAIVQHDLALIATHTTVFNQHISIQHDSIANTVQNENSGDNTAIGTGSRNSTRTMFAVDFLYSLSFNLYIYVYGR